MARLFDDVLPNHATLRKAALEYILSGKPYLGIDLVKAIADKLAITLEQLALQLPTKGQAAFENYVDHVKREFTEKGYHTGPNGGKHKGKEEKYYVSALGLAIARLAAQMDEGGVEQLVSEPPETPTDDPELLNGRVEELLRRAREGSGPPRSDPPNLADDNVQQVQVTTPRFVRKPGVCARVRMRAEGQCEACGKPAPFRDSAANPFLEVHHVRPLADGGPDRDDNAIAVCPNCHRELHYGIEKEDRRKAVLKSVAGLADHPVRPLRG